MPKYDVEVTRSQLQRLHIEVEADDREDAEDKALEQAGDLDFSNGTGSPEPEYEVTDVEEVDGPAGPSQE